MRETSHRKLKAKLVGIGVPSRAHYFQAARLMMCMPCTLHGSADGCCNQANSMLSFGAPVTGNPAV